MGKTTNFFFFGPPSWNQMTWSTSSCAAWTTADNKIVDLVRPYFFKIRFKVYFSHFTLNSYDAFTENHRIPVEHTLESSDQTRPIISTSFRCYYESQSMPVDSFLNEAEYIPLPPGAYNLLYRKLKNSVIDFLSISQEAREMLLSFFANTSTLKFDCTEENNLSDKTHFFYVSETFFCCLCFSWSVTMDIVRTWF